MRTSMAACALALALALLAPPAVRGAAKTLDIYFIDVEGGQSTLIVTPAGESLLVDTGYGGFDNRDPKRILAAARDAGVNQIDFLLTTHFHTDHDGGVVELARMLPIRSFIDHGGMLLPQARSDPQWPQYSQAFEAYRAVRATGKHLEPRPGDRLPLKGIDVEIVSSSGATISSGVEGIPAAPNPACGPSAPAPNEAIENPRSTGFRLRFGRFRFIDLGDLTGAPLFALLCPRNLLGEVEVFLVPHHGGADAVYPAIFAVRPRVAIMNNGATKGGAPQSFSALHEAQRAHQVEDVWQLRGSMNPGAANFGEDHIANLDATTGFWIKVSGSEDGSFSVTNSRTGATARYRVSASSRKGSR